MARGFDDLDSLLTVTASTERAGPRAGQLTPCAHYSRWAGQLHSPATTVYYVQSPRQPGPQSAPRPRPAHTEVHRHPPQREREPLPGAVQREARRHLRGHGRRLLLDTQVAAIS